MWFLPLSYRNNRILILGMCNNSEFMEPIGKLHQNKSNMFYIKETHCMFWYTTTYFSEFLVKLSYYIDEILYF